MRSSLSRLIVLPLLVCLMSCAGTVSRNLDLRVVIENVFPDNSIQVGSPAVTLIAVVTNDPRNEGVTWSLSTANVACSPACGTLVPMGRAGTTYTATYTPPKTAPLNQQAVISATSVDDPVQNYSFIFTIIPPTSVTITDKFSSIIAGSPGVVVNATVSNDSTDGGVNWTLTTGGSNCSPACGTLVASAAPSFSALYTPPATVPAGADANPTITATSVANSSATDSFSFAIDTANSLLSGSYVFLLRGYDSFSGQPMAMAGAVTADGKGDITSGELDFNNDGGVTHIPSPATGTYVIDDSFNGITRGTIEITSFTFPNSNIDLKFRFAISADQKRGHIIEFDGSGYLNSGMIQLQDSSATSTAPSGNFAFGLDSDAPLAGRTVAAGQLIFGANGITGGVIDQSKAGDPQPTYSAQAVTSSSVASPDSNGRGRLTITVNGLTNDYAYYIIDSDHMRLIEIDQGLNYGTVQAGTAVLQHALTASSIQATSVLQLTGMDEPSGTDSPGPDVIIGVMNISAQNNFNLTFDSNDLGSVLTSHPAAGAITSFDPTTGRAVLSDPGGFESGFVDSAVIYLYDKGDGFAIDTDISTPNGTPPDQAITNNAFSGTLTLQTGAPFSAATALSGNLVAGFGASASSNIPNWDLGVALNSSNGPYSAGGEFTSSASEGGNALNAQFSGSYELANTTLGHGAMTLPAAVFGDFVSGNTVTATFYLIAPNQFVLIQTSPETPPLESGVAFFDPQ